MALLYCTVHAFYSIVLLVFAGLLHNVHTTRAQGQVHNVLYIQLIFYQPTHAFMSFSRIHREYCGRNPVSSRKRDVGRKLEGSLPPIRQ
jgi:hypothetical protein